MIGRTKRRKAGRALAEGLRNTGKIRRRGFTRHMNVVRRWVVLAASVAAVAVFSPSFAADVASLTPADAAARVAAGTAVLVDVREAAEWSETGVVATAQLLALSDLRGPRAHWKTFLEANRDKELILYCRSGNRSGQAAQILAAEGFRVANAGGFQAWVAAGQPTRQADAPARTP